MEGLYTPVSETGFALQTNLLFSDSNYCIMVIQRAKISVFFPAILPQMLGTSWYSVKKKKLIGLEKEGEEIKEENSCPSPNTPAGHDLRRLSVCLCSSIVPS